METFLFSLLNIKRIVEDSSLLVKQNPADLLSFCLSLICCLLYISLPFFIFRVLAREPFQLGWRKSQTYRYYGELYRNTKFSQSFFAKHYIVFFLIRRYIYVMVLFLL